MPPPSPLCPSLRSRHAALLEEKDAFSRALTHSLDASLPLEERKRHLRDALSLKHDIERGIADIENMLTVSLVRAESIFGAEHVFRPEENERVFGTLPETLPRIPFKEEDLLLWKRYAEEMNTFTKKSGYAIFPELILEQSTMKDRETGAIIPLTLKNLKKNFPTAHDGAPSFYSQDWYEQQEGSPFYDTETPPTRWKLVMTGVSLGADSADKATNQSSVDRNYVEQTDFLARELPKLYGNGARSKELERAIEEWRGKREAVTRLIPTDWQKASDELAALKLTGYRESESEVFFRLIMADQAKQRKELPNHWVWTKSRTSSGRAVGVGGFNSGGTDVSGSVPRYRSGTLGVCLSRS